jgi:hypothetical protein
MHSDVVNDLAEIFWQRIAKVLNSRWRRALAPCGGFKMASRQASEFKMASRQASEFKMASHHAVNSKWRPLFAASAPG